MFVSGVIAAGSLIGILVLSLAAAVVLAWIDRHADLKREH